MSRKRLWILRKRYDFVATGKVTSNGMLTQRPAFQHHWLATPHTMTDGAGENDQRAPITKSCKPTMLDLPDELIVLVLEWVSTQCLGRFQRASKGMHSLVVSNETTLYRRLLERYLASLDVVPAGGDAVNNTLGSITTCPGQWRILLSDALLWGRNLPQTVTKRSARYAVAPTVGDKDCESSDARSYIDAVPGAGGEIGLTVRIIGPNSICTSWGGLRIQSIDGDGECRGSISRSSSNATLCGDGQGGAIEELGLAQQDDDVFAGMNPKWIDDHTPSSDTFSGSGQLMAINEWSEDWQGGYTSIFETSECVPRKQNSKEPLRLVACFRALETAHIAITHGNLYAACTAWWTMPHPGDASEPKPAFIRLFKVLNDAGATQSGKTPEWTFELPAHHRPRSLALSETYLACAVEAAAGYRVMVLDVRTGALLGQVTSSVSESGVFDRDAGVQSIHLLRNVLLVQASGTLHVYLLIPSPPITNQPRAVLAQPLAAVQTGDVAPIHVFKLPSSTPSAVQDQEPTLMVCDFQHPERVCLLQPASLKKRWVSAARVAGDSGIWCLYRDADGSKPKALSELGLVWKRIEPNHVDR
ncbi:uncharacterized protein EV422DRAFT_514113 [Fimicolochytrium jonesii]|uniref:uncharacterized protein n=1 Tax=Fimicolochytrium jonesii TaxID=1396493 RepID=UPI0022FEC4FA|nr:uncharacterized protein EV422DRAFT_514113 [Fimicolochytrium jonesii]KAI8825781.1 hypothetical protein EV422DRAFT_514113 [Fimicolochytrium jonesii]